MCERLADAARDQLDQKVGDRFLHERPGRRARLGECSAQAGLHQVRQREADQHGNERVDEIEDHHHRTLPAVDLIADDSAQDRQHDQRRGQGGERAEDQLGQDLQRDGSLAPEEPERNGDDDRDDHPDVQGHAPRPAFRFILNMGRTKVCKERG